MKRAQEEAAKEAKAEAEELERVEKKREGKIKRARKE